MYLLLGILRFMLWLLSGGFGTVRAERAWQPVEGLALPGLPGIRQPRSSGVEWMSVRPVPERFGVPPECYHVVPVLGATVGRRRLPGYRVGAAGLFPAMGQYRPVLI
jgi:hypothetical protein